MTPIRVCLLNDHLGWQGQSLHGVSRYFLSVVPRFDPNLVRPTLAILRPPDPLVSVFDDAGVPVEFLAPGGSGALAFPRTLRALVSLLRRERIEVIHAQGYGGTTLARIVAPLLGIRVVLHSHEADDRYPGLMRLPDRLLAPLCHHAFANGVDSRDFFIHQRAMPKDRTQLLHNGIDLTRMQTPGAPAPNARAELDRELGLAPDADVVLTLTRFSPEKGNHVLIDALPELLRTRPGAVVLFAGQGAELSNCQALAERIGVAHACRFLGFRSDAAALLSRADVAVIPSLREGTCYALLEALALGVPTVASNVGGLAEVLEHERTGHLVAAADPIALAAGLDHVLAHPDYARALTSAGLDRVRDFDVAIHVRHLSAVYRALLDRSPVPDAPA